MPLLTIAIVDVVRSFCSGILLLLILHIYACWCYCYLCSGGHHCCIAGKGQCVLERKCVDDGPGWWLEERRTGNAWYIVWYSDYWWEVFCVGEEETSDRVMIFILLPLYGAGYSGEKMTVLMKMILMPIPWYHYDTIILFSYAMVLMIRMMLYGVCGGYPLYHSRDDTDTTVLILHSVIYRCSMHAVMPDGGGGILMACCDVQWRENWRRRDEVTINKQCGGGVARAVSWLWHQALNGVIFRKVWKYVSQ